MWRDELTKEFWSNGRRMVEAWYRYQRLGILSFLGAVMIVPISSLEKALSLTPIAANQGGVVDVASVNNRLEASILIAQTPTTIPATLPPAVLPANQTPTVSVPPLQPIPSQTPTPVTTFQPLERSPESVSPAVSSSPVIEFGQPLPKTTPASPAPTPPDGLPTLGSGAALLLK